MKKHIISFLLFIAAVLLGLFFFPVFALYYLLKLFKQRGFNYFFLTLAYYIDLMGNVVGEELLNDKLIATRSNWYFGKSGMTISAVLGLLQRDKNLTSSGVILVDFLDWIDKDHCKLAMEAYLEKENPF